MIFGFSLAGLVFLVMLFVPNILWSRYPPENYDEYSKNENKLLLTFERIGEVLVTIFSLFCGNTFNMFLAIAAVLMILYEMYWIRYFKSSRTMKDMYGNFVLSRFREQLCPLRHFSSWGCAETIYC